MPDTVDVLIPVGSDAAALLGDATKRASVGLLVSRLLQPASLERLLEVMDAISAEAARRGLTEEILEAELAAYNGERRERDPPPA